MYCDWVTYEASILRTLGFLKGTFGFLKEHS